MPIGDEKDDYTAGDVKAWREGGWVLVTLRGDLIYKRYTRDTAFTHAAVIFNGARSPDYPKTRQHLDRVELVGDWRWQTHWTRNNLIAQISKNEENN